jgi:hypothetical protein
MSQGKPSNALRAKGLEKEEDFIRTIKSPSKVTCIRTEKCHRLGNMKTIYELMCCAGQVNENCLNVSALFVVYVYDCGGWLIE